MTGGNAQEKLLVNELRESCPADYVRMLESVKKNLSKMTETARQHKETTLLYGIKRKTVCINSQYALDCFKNTVKKFLGKKGKERKRWWGLLLLEWL
jgi:hypothetical protein